MAAKKTKLGLSMSDFDPIVTPSTADAPVNLPENDPVEEVITPVSTEKKEKRAVGRPKTKEPCTNINVAVPNRLLDKINEVVLGTKVDYITKLIEKDMTENYERYKAIKDQLENI